jgi:hypothetical protein
MKMKRCSILTFASLLAFFQLLRAQDTTKSFQQLLQQNSLQFTLPADFWGVRVRNNPDVAYDYAICSKTQKLEIRYRIWPVTQTTPVYETMLVTMALNVSNGQMIQPTPYPKPDVKAEFGADAGCSGMVHTNSQFGHDYKYCMISAIHKDGIADVYAFYLFDDPNIAMQTIFTDQVFHALKFR